jgi:carboxymethylenebutenolidase
MGAFETIQVGVATTRAYVAGDFEPGAGGVVLLHAWWGLNHDIVAFADRLAAEGHAVVAPDMFDGQVAETIDHADQLAGSSDEAAIQPIVRAAVDLLASRLGEDVPLVAVGFSFGAAWAVWAPTELDGVAASVVYYGTYTGSVLSRASVPVLGHFAEDDPYETAETVAEFEQGLREAGREATIHRYPGTGHWFAEPSRDAYQSEAAELAFGRTIAFLRQHLATRVGRTS